MLKKLLLASAIAFLPLSAMAADAPSSSCQEIDLTKVSKYFHVEYGFALDKTHVINIFRSDKRKADGTAIVLAILIIFEGDTLKQACLVQQGLVSQKAEDMAKQSREDSAAGKFDTPDTPNHSDAPASPAAPLTDMPRGE